MPCSELLLPQTIVTDVIPGLGGLSDPNAYLYWVVSITGMITIAAAFLHAFFWQPISSILGAIVSLMGKKKKTKSREFASTIERISILCTLDYLCAHDSAFSATLVTVMWVLGCHKV